MFVIYLKDTNQMKTRDKYTFNFSNRYVLVNLQYTQGP